MKTKVTERAEGAKTAPDASRGLSNRANPIPGTLQTIRGYPDRLRIFRIPASSYWWVRATFGERRIKRSTKEQDKAKAIAYAKQFYEELLRNNHAVPLGTSRSVTRVAHSLRDERRQKATTGERSGRFEDDLRRQLDFRIEPFFKKYAIKDINYEILSKFVGTMRADEISPSTIKAHLVSVRQVLKHAFKLQLIDRLPIFPTVSYKDNPRPWFSDTEYKHLKEISKETVKTDFSWKGHKISIEAHHFITFMVNTFLRPSDWYALRRKHITIRDGDDHEPLLIINPPISKTINTPIVSMPAAVAVFAALKAHQDEQRAMAIEEQQKKIEQEITKRSPRKNSITQIEKKAVSLKPYDEDSYVFLPHIESRSFAQRVMGAFYDKIVSDAGLSKSHAGVNRTIYSLRHTAIALRLLRGENVDLLFLARNCRTSVAMLDRFYCRHLNAMMAPEKIVGIKTKTKPKT